MKISIITVVKNGLPLLKSAIKSIKNQNMHKVPKHRKNGQLEIGHSGTFQLFQKIENIFMKIRYYCQKRSNMQTYINRKTLTVKINKVRNKYQV